MRDPKTTLFSLSARQLQALALLGDHRNIHRAAAALNVSQPAISKLLNDIERRIETRLFTRGPRGVEPTAAGDVLIRHARSIQGEIGRAADDLTALSLGRPETLRIGTLQSSAATLVPEAVQRLRQEMPRLSISISEGVIGPLMEELASARIDVVVGRIGYRPKGSEFDERYISDEHLRIVVRPGHALAARRRIGWPDVHPFDWLLPAPGTALRQRVEMLLAETRTPVSDRIFESSSMICSLALLSKSDMVMPLPDELARHFQSLGQLSILPIELPEMFGPIGAVWRRTSPESDVTARFVQLLVQCSEKFHSGPRRRKPKANRTGALSR